jgi:hypothetical protein|tara:strand:+ start:3764 stop:4543 length:780 start_codon:yes stop_codon:yes gene_type:complete
VTDYVGDFFTLLSKLKKGEHFAFSRYSDGEVFVMQNIKVVLGSEQVEVGEKVYNFGYSKDDFKEFLPERDQFVREQLLESFTYAKKNYFIGAGCDRCTCAIKEYIPWLQEIYNNGDEHWTTPNLFVNANYPLFVNHYIPEFSNHKIVMVCSENADLEELPFKVVKDFRVGENCIVNDHELVDEIAEWIQHEDIKDHVFLFSASSLSEILIYKLFKLYDQNSYIDIGTTMHKWLGLSLERDYLRAYWSGAPLMDLFKKCT